MQLVDPEDIPAMERLTQKVLLLREKVASVESQGQETLGNRRQQVSHWTINLIFTVKQTLEKLSISVISEGERSLCSKVGCLGQQQQEIPLTFVIPF